MDILDIIASDNYIPYNRTLAKEIGVEKAIIFGALCGYQRKFKQQEFFREQQNIMEDTCLTEYAVRKSIKELKQLGLINVVKKGLPAKYYFKINTTRLIDMLSTSGYENDTTGSNENISTGDIENITTNNKNINNKKENKNKYNNICIFILEYLNEKAGTRYRLVENNFKHINARLQDFSISDLKCVIDKKVKEWKGTEFEKYLNPDTLFRPSNFEKYLNQKIDNKGVGNAKSKADGSMYANIR